MRKIKETGKAILYSLPSIWFDQLQKEGIVEKVERLLELIEAEFQKLQVNIESIQDETCRTLGSHDRRLKSLKSRLDGTIKAQDLIAEKIEVLEKRVLKNLQKECELLYSLESRIKTLEQRVPDYSKQGHDVDRFYPPNPPKDVIPTDKDEPQFQVRDIIELFGGGLRIVLKVKSDREMELLDVFTGNRWWTSFPQNYTLIYRPGSPKPEPTVKEKIPTDKDGKPEGGLERGDVMSYTIDDKASLSYGKKILIQFAGKETDYQYRYWQNLNSGTKDAFCYNGFMSRDRVTFEFRPQYPGSKDRIADKLQALEVVFGMFNELSPETQKAFEEAVKRMKSVHTGS